MEENETSTEVLTPKPDNVCGECGFQAKGKAGLATHIIRKHGDPSRATAWAKGIKRAQKAKLAQGIKHTEKAKTGDFECAKCGDTFATIQALGLHKFRAHTRAGKRPLGAALGKAKAKIGRPRKGEEKNESAAVLKNREYQRQWREKQQKKKEQSLNGIHESHETGLAPAREPNKLEATCPNFCPSCGFNLAAVGIALALNNKS